MLAALSGDAARVHALEKWFRSRGHRLELEPSEESRRFAAIVRPGGGPLRGQALLVALGRTRLTAAQEAQSAFRRGSPSG